MSSDHENPVPGKDGGGPGIHRRVRLAYLVSHPVQYQAPLLRRIAREPEIDLTVFYGSDFSVRGYRDEGFGVDVKWDIPLLEGYRYEFLPAVRDNGTEGLLSPVSAGITARLAQGFDVLWVHGYATANQIHGILAAKALGIPVLVRSDSSLRDRPRGGLKLAAKAVFFRLLRELVDGVLVTGTLNRQYWQHYLGKDFPLFLLPYAVDNAWFQEQCRLAVERRAELTAELNLESGRPVILFASKLQTRKHCDDLVAAYPGAAWGTTGTAASLTCSSSATEKNGRHSKRKPRVWRACASAGSAISRRCRASSISPQCSCCPRATSPGA